MKITVEQVEYNKESHDVFLQRLTELDYDIISALENKSLLVGQIKVADVITGIFIFRIEDMLSGEKELVICHVISDKTSTSNFTSMALPFVKQLARQNKIKTMRLHTTDKATEKLAEKQGFRFQETILVTEVD